MIHAKAKKMTHNLEWSSVKFLFYVTGTNAKINLCTLLKFIEQKLVYILSCRSNNLFTYNVTTNVFFFFSEFYLSVQDINKNQFCFYFITLAANYIGRHCNLCNIDIIFIRYSTFISIN